MKQGEMIRLSENEYLNFRDKLGTGILEESGSVKKRDLTWPNHPAMLPSFMHEEFTVKG